MFILQVNYLDASEERGRESDQSSYQQSDEQDTESDSDAGPDFGECSVSMGEYPAVGHGAVFSCGPGGSVQLWVTGSVQSGPAAVFHPDYG